MNETPVVIAKIAQGDCLSIILFSPEKPVTIYGFISMEAIILMMRALRTCVKNDSLVGEELSEISIIRVKKLGDEDLFEVTFTRQDATVPQLAMNLSKESILAIAQKAQSIETQVIQPLKVSGCPINVKIEEIENSVIDPQNLFSMKGLHDERTLSPKPKKKGGDK